MIRYTSIDTAGITTKKTMNMVGDEDKQRTTAIDETGKRYGKLLVIERGTKGGKNRGADWICRCDCGQIESVLGTRLRSGRRVMCKKCADEVRKEQGVNPNGKPSNPSEVTMIEQKRIEAQSTVKRLRKLRDKLRIGESYIVAMRIPHAEEYSTRCTLLEKYPKYGLFKTERGICTCLDYHAIMTEQMLFTDELVPRRITA